MKNVALLVLSSLPQNKEIQKEQVYSSLGFSVQTDSVASDSGKADHDGGMWQTGHDITHEVMTPWSTSSS